MADEIITRGVATRAQVRQITRGWTAKRRKAFLDVLATSANVSLAARAVGVDPTSPHQLRKRDPAFAEQWHEAMQCGYELIEQALIQRARGGVNAVEIDPGVLVLTDDGKPLRSYGEAKLVEGRVEMDVKLAMWLLERQDKRAGVTPPRASAFGAPTRAAVEAKILKKLDALAKRPKT